MPSPSFTEGLYLRLRNLIRKRVKVLHAPAEVFELRSGDLVIAAIAGIDVGFDE